MDTLLRNWLAWDYLTVTTNNKSVWTLVVAKEQLEDTDLKVLNFLGVLLCNLWKIADDF